MSSRTHTADVQSLTLAGKRFVVLPEAEYRRLCKAAGTTPPRLPQPDAQGHYPAVDTLRRH